MQQAVCVRRGKQKKIGKKNTKKNAAPKTHHEIHSNPATATNSRRRASCYFCAILGSPPASLGQVTRWESKGVRSFVCWSANELTLDSFFCSYWATEQFCTRETRKNVGVGGELDAKAWVPFSFFKGRPAERKKLKLTNRLWGFWAKRGWSTNAGYA